PTEQLVLKNSLVNPSPGIYTADFASTGTYLVNYSTNPGVVQVYGDYQVTGSTLSLDYASQLYTSTATTPKLMWGAGHSATVNSTNDSYAVSQLITITFKTSDSSWHVTGSSEASGDFCSGAAGALLTCNGP